MQSNSALRLINNATASDAAAADALAKKGRPARIPSKAAQLAQQQFTYLSQAWGGVDVSDATRDAYIALGKEYPLGSNPTSAGRSVWMSLGMTRYHMGLEPLLTPPSGPQTTLPVPTFTLTATVSAGGVFSLRVLPTADFSANKTIIAATRSLSGGTMAIAPGQHQVLEVDDNLLQAGVAIGASWLALYGRVPDVGRRIGVSLTPVTALGFLGSPLYEDVLVTAV